MSSIPRLALSEFFGLLEPTYVLGTTFTLSLAFFEGLVFPKISRSALRRCLVLSDQTGFQAALVEAGALRGAGSDYMAACVPCRHSFHAKVWLLIGQDEAAILVGSGNLTQSGFMDNVELFDAIQFRKGGPYRTVADGVSTFLAGLQGHWDGLGQRDLLVRGSLVEMQQAVNAIATDMPLDTNPQVRFLSSYTVDRFAGHCTVRGCPMQHMVDLRKRALVGYRPVICSGCGSVLVPDPLMREYEARNGHTTR